MARAAAPPPTKKRKLSEIKGSVFDKDDLLRSFCKRGKDRKKVQRSVGWQGTNGMLQTCRSDIKKNVEDMYRSPEASHHDHLENGLKLLSHGCSSSMKMGELRDLLPSRKFHSFKKRTSRSGKKDSVKGDANKCLPNGHVLDAKVVDRRKPDSDSFPVKKVQHAENSTYCLKIKSSMLNEGFKEASRKITKEYVRKKHRQSHSEDESPDLYNLLLLADTAISYASDPTLDIQAQKSKETSPKGHNDHQSSSANSDNSTFKMHAKRRAEQVLMTEAIADHILKDSQSVKASIIEQASTEEKQIVLTSTYENQKIKQDLSIRISGHELGANSLLTEFQLSEGCVLRKFLVTGILVTSKQKADSMVNAAIKTLSSLKEGENAYAMIGKALDSAGIAQAGAGSRISGAQHSYLQNEASKYPDQASLCKNEDMTASLQYINPKVGTSSPNDADILSELISACVAALLMIQTCCNTRLPPAEAMEIIELAARGLQPRCSKNLHIYREIEQLMTIIKTQVLALQPVPSSSLQV